MGAIDPTILAARNARIGNTKLRVDLHGDALGAAVLPGLVIAGEEHNMISSKC